MTTEPQAQTSERERHPACLAAEATMVPCAFCGGKGELRQESEDKIFVPLMWEAGCTDDGCPGFSLHIKTKTMKAAVAKWNTRADADQIRDLQAKLTAREADAERYRRIRNGPYSDRHGDVYAMVFDAEGDVPVHGDVLDAAMDAIFKRESPNG